MSIDTPLSPVPASADALIAAAQGMEDNEIQALVARLVIDSLGRPWDPLKHPRDAEGKFIETFAEIRGLFRTSGGAKGDPKITGRVVAFDHNGDVLVRVDHVAPGYTEHKVGDLVPIKPDDMVALDAKAKINRPLNDQERSGLAQMARDLRGIDPDAADAFDRAADPANTEMISQLADLQEARDLLNDNADDEWSPKARDMIWDLADKLGDHPTNDEIIQAAKHMVRDHLAKTPGNTEAVARLDRDIHAEAPPGQPGAPDDAQKLAGQLHRVADRLQDQNPADAVHVRNVAAKLGDAGVSGQSADTRDARLEAAATAALKINTPALKKKIIADIKHMRENPPEPQAPDAAPEKARLGPPEPAASLPAPAAPEAATPGGVLDWARANAKAGNGIKPNENPPEATPEELLVRQAKVEAEIEAIKVKADKHANKLPIPAQAARLDALVKEHDAIKARITDAAPPAEAPNHPGPTLIGRLVEMAKAGGFTFDPRTNTFKETGFAVARQGLGGVPFDADSPEAFDKINDYIDANWERFQADPEAYLGGWESNGQIYLDVPDVLESKPDAIATGTERFEIAIADLAKYAAGEDGEIRLQYATRPPAGTPAHDDWTDLEGVRHVNESADADSAPAGAGGDEGPVQAPSGEGPGSGPVPDAPQPEDRGPGEPAPDVTPKADLPGAPREFKTLAHAIRPMLDRREGDLAGTQFVVAGKTYTYNGPSKFPYVGGIDITREDDGKHFAITPARGGGLFAPKYGMHDLDQVVPAYVAPPTPGTPAPVDAPASASPDELDPEDQTPPDETAEAIIPAFPQMGQLAPDMTWENHPEGMFVLGNGAYQNRELLKSMGARFIEVPGHAPKRDGAPFKAWAFQGNDDRKVDDLKSFASRLGLPEPGVVADAEDEYPPTEQQQAVIDAVNTGEDVAVRALAGTGKTSTLKMIARRLLKSDPAKRIVYVAFNKSIQEEAQKTMPPNVEARTGDSIAYATLSPGMKAKFEDKSALRRNGDIAAFLGITDPLPTLVVGEKPMQPDEQAMRIMRAIEQYSISADDKLGVEHFKNLDVAVAKKLLPYAEKAWLDLNADDGRLKMSFSHIFKAWALSKPDFRSGTSGLKRKADIVFFDEAQDINPVMAKVIADQQIQKVYVGDSNQAIYAFRGAVDELDNVDVQHDLPLTKSWRFGPQIAGMGNRFLALLGSKHRIDGAGPEGSVVEPYSMTDPDAILVRSNAGAISEILAAQTDGKIVGVPKGAKGDLRRLVDTARWLQRGGPAPAQIHDDLAAFRNWDEVAKAADAGDDPKVKMLYKIIEDTGVDKLSDLVDRLVDSGDKKDTRTPDMVVSTAHKAKGLEWDKVKIGGDFWGPRLDKKTGELVMPSPEEMRLAYVAVTRAMKELDPGSLEWVFEYTNENGDLTPSTAPAKPAPATSPSSLARWFPEDAELAPGEASRPLGPSAPPAPDTSGTSGTPDTGPDTPPPPPSGTPAPDGWAKLAPTPGWDPGDIWKKDAYVVQRGADNNPDGLRIAEHDENDWPFWRADADNWADVERQVNEREKFKAEGGLPQDDRDLIATYADNYGFGPDVVRAILDGTPDQIQNALDQDPNYHAMHAAYVEADGAQQMRPAQRKAYADWVNFQAQVLLALEKARLLTNRPTPELLKQEKPDTALPQAPEVPAVPAYSGEIREPQPRDRAEILNAADNAERWLGVEIPNSGEGILIQDPLRMGEGKVLDRLKGEWVKLGDAVRARKYGDAQPPLDAVREIIADTNVKLAFREDMQAYVDQVQGVLDKLQQRDQGQFEIPGAAPVSAPPRVEQGAPELNAAFDDLLQTNPDANARMKRFAAELNGLRNQIRDHGGDEALNDQIQGAIDALNREDYQGAFDALDGVFNQPHGDTPTESWVTAPERFSQYGDFRIANDAFAAVWDDWQAMLAGNPDLAKYTPDAQEPLQSWERALLDPIGAQKSGTGPEGDAPGPYEPAADPEIVIPDPPGDGTPVKDEHRTINPRIRGEIEDVKRGVGLPELPDRLDIDKNGAVVFALDLVDVPAAGNQGPQGGMRRPAGIAQVRRVYTKKGVRYAEVAFYDPAFVDAPNRNAKKRAKGLKNDEPFYIWDGVRLDKVQKVNGDSPDAADFLANLGPEEARQYAGRNAGRLAQNRGRVRPELERMANLQYIGDRYVPDRNGLPVGKGDVVVYNGKKYEVVRVNNDDPGVGNNVRVDLLPLGADGDMEIQAGGKHAEPYARMVEFYDQPLGDRKPAVTVDELKDLVRRLDGNKKYVVGDALRSAIASGDLKEITRAFNEDPAVLTYIADGRAYINDYVGRLLQANLRGDFGAIKRNEQEMVRKDKNDLLNAMAAIEGRFLEGTGADRHIKREIPAAGPDAEYKGNRPEVLMPLRYVQAKKAMADAREGRPDNPLWESMDAAMARAGAINLDAPDDFYAAEREFIAIQDAMYAEGYPEVGDALSALITAMDDWRADQDKRRAITQGGPGGVAQLPRGRTVAPGLVREPGLSRPDAGVPAAPVGPKERTPQDLEYGVAIVDDKNLFDRYYAVREALDAAIKVVDSGDPELFAYLRGVQEDFMGARYGAAYHAIDILMAVPQDRADAPALNGFQARLSELGVYFDLRTALNGVRGDWLEEFFPDTAAPAALQKPEDIKKAIADAVEARYAELRADRKNNEARKQAVAVQDAGDILASNIQTALDYNDGEGNNNDTRDTYVSGAVDQIDKIRADNPELAAELDRQIEALRATFQLQDQTRLIDKYFAEADKYHNRDNPDNEQRDRMIRAAQDQIDMARSSYPALAGEMQTKLDGMKAQYEIDDKERARAKPVGRTEAQDNFEAVVDAERKRLRDEGDATAARNIVKMADEIAGPLNDAEDAHKAGNKEERDAAIEQARAAIPDLEAVNPDLAEEARKAIEGNAARFAHADERAAGGGPDVVLGGLDDGADWSIVNQAALDFAGISMEKMRRDKRVGDWEFKDSLSNGINGIDLWKNSKTGAYVCIKKDTDEGRYKGNGAASEEMVARLYRDLGFAQPAAVLINPDAPTKDQGNDLRSLVAMSYAGEGAWGLNDIDMVQRWDAALDEIDEKHQLEVFQFVVANGIIGNSDRHLYNLMWGADPNTGKRRIVPIDNGMALMNGNHGSAERSYSTGDALALRPGEIIQGRHGNENVMRNAAAEWAAAHPEARDEMMKFVKRMQERAKLMSFVDDRAYDYINVRAQWVLDHLDDYLGEIG